MNSDQQKAFYPQARQLLKQSSSGSLATQSRKHPGYPFVSLAPFALGENLEPIFLFSSLATHTRNAARNPAASLLLTASGDNSGELTSSRMTLLGDLRQMRESELESAQQSYLDQHPAAQQWVSFGDFHFFQLQLVESYFVAGFGSMGWISPEHLTDK